MKGIISTIGFVVVLCIGSNAQFYKTMAPSPAFSDAIEKIVLDFRFNFQNIQGEMIAREGSSETFGCSISIPGALETYIYQFNSRLDTTASLQSIMYRGDDYNEAEKKYSEIFRMVKRTHVKWIDRTMIGFKGKFEKPTESIRFSSSSLDLDLDDNRYNKFKAEVELVSTYAGWEVHLNMQTRKPDGVKDSDYF